MNCLRYSLAVACAALATLPLAAQQKRISPHETVSAVLGDRFTGNRITITYGRPYTKSPKTGEIRTIWGGLVAWDKADRLGADEATLFVAQRPVMAAGTLIPAGAYTLYIIPSEAGVSKLAFSSDVGKWGVPVDETHDFARVDLKKEALAAPVDQLTIGLEKAEGGLVLAVKWENTEYSLALSQPPPQIDFPQISPLETVKQRIGVTDVEIVYSRPSLKGRVMIGGINPYGEVWRTGANNATRISFSTPVTLQGTALDAGTYELFTMPNRDTWTLILQKPMKQWGAYAYDPKNDVARVTAQPIELADSVETFTISFDNVINDSAILSLSWGKVRVPFSLEVDDKATVVPEIKAAMAAAGPKPYSSAAVFYLEHGLDLKQASDWMDAAIADQPDAFFLMYQKARILAREGDKAGAEAEARKSMDLASKAQEPLKSEYLRLNEALIAGLK